ASTRADIKYICRSVFTPHSPGRVDRIVAFADSGLCTLALGRRPVATGRGCGTEFPIRDAEACFAARPARGPGSDAGFQFDGSARARQCAVTEGFRGKCL